MHKVALVLISMPGPKVGDGCRPHTDRSHAARIHMVHLQEVANTVGYGDVEKEEQQHTVPVPVLDMVAKEDQGDKATVTEVVHVPGSD